MIKWRAQEIIYYGQKYAKREGSDEVYDYESYNAALQDENVSPLLVGHWAVDKGGKQFIRLAGEDNDKEEKRERE